MWCKYCYLKPNQRYSFFLLLLLFLLSLLLLSLIYESNEPFHAKTCQLNFIIRVNDLNDMVHAFNYLWFNKHHGEEETLTGCSNNCSVERKFIYFSVTVDSIEKKSILIEYLTTITHLLLIIHRFNSSENYASNQFVYGFLFKHTQRIGALFYSNRH